MSQMTLWSGNDNEECSKTRMKMLFFKSRASSYTAPLLGGFQTCTLGCLEFLKRMISNFLSNCVQTRCRQLCLRNQIKNLFRGILTVNDSVTGEIIVIHRKAQIWHTLAICFLFCNDPSAALVNDSEGLFVCM